MATVGVSDDGSGFDPERVEPSFGLVGMQERVGLAGGSLEVDSEVGRGTRVRATLPLAGSKRAASPPRSRGAERR